MLVKTTGGGKTLDIEHHQLSDLLEAALADLEQSIADGLEARMNSWALSRGGAVCSVCLAGAVVRNGLGDDPIREETIDPEKLVEAGACTRGAANQLYAIDCMRLGDFLSAYQYMPQCTSAVDERSNLGAKLKELEEIADQAEILVDTDWQDGRSPGSTLLLFKDEIVPAMRRLGL